MKVKLSEIVKDGDIYPRREVSRLTVESYVEALKAGVVFPPIEVQRVRNGDEVQVVCLDGWHRLEAYTEWAKVEGKPVDVVEVTFWRDEVLDKEKNLLTLMLRSVELNVAHGLRLSQGDMKHMLQGMAGLPGALDFTWKDIAKTLNVTPQWVSECVASTLSARRMSRNAAMYKLSLLGWVQEEIGELYGLDQRTVSYNTNEFNQLNSLVKSDFHEKRKPIEEVASYYKLDMPLAWAIVLDGLDDLERMKRLEMEPRPYDVWNYQGCDDLFGFEYDGRIPGQLILQLLYFYTKQGDLVVDPMAGSGTVVDACLVMGRRCLAFDINPKLAERRVEIRTSDAIDAIKGLRRKAQLIFLDPPYFKKKEDEYGEASISSLSMDEYLDYFTRLARECLEKLSSDGRVALLMSDYTEDDPTESIFIHHYIERFEDETFLLERRIYAPLTSQQIHPDIQIKFTESRRLARLVRDLVVFRAAKPK